MVYIVFLIVFALGLFYFLSKNQKKEFKEMQAAQDAFKYENHILGSILVIKKKSSVAANSLIIHAHREVFTKEVPDRIVYTGATVGGITTGGFHIQKGGTAYTMGDLTGKFSLCYKYASTVNNQPWSEVISFLQLSDELMKEAKISPMLKNRIVTDEQQKQLEKLYGFKEKKNLVSLIDLNDETARSIKSWLSGNGHIHSTKSSNDKGANTSTTPQKTPNINSRRKMNELFKTAHDETVCFVDNGIIVTRTEIGLRHSKFYPYNLMETFKASFRLGVIIRIYGTDTSGEEYELELWFSPVNDERGRLKRAVDFAKKNIGKE